MAVTNKQRRYLKGLAHPLKPVVMLGNKGLTETVLQEINDALAHHELIKVKVSGQERDARNTLLTHIAEQADAELVMTIGNIGAFYRASEKANIQLPKD